MAFKDITDRDVLAARSRAVGGSRKKCTKGKSCSATCIDPNESCLVEFPAPVSSSLAKVKDEVLSKEELTKNKDFLIKMRDDFKDRTFNKIKESIRFKDEITYNRLRRDIIALNEGLPSEIKPVKVPIAWEKVQKIDRAYDRAIDNIFAKLEKARFTGDQNQFAKQVVKLNDMYRVLGVRLGKENQTKFTRWNNYPDSKFLSKIYSADLKGAKLIYNGEDLIIKKQIGNNTLSVRFGDYGLVFGFMVNGSYSADPSIPRREGVAIALAAKEIFNKIVSSMDEGSVITVTPYGGDGKGEGRRRTYEAYGFRDGPGEEMYGKVRRGKVVGASQDEYYDYLNDGNFNLPS